MALTDVKVRQAKPKEKRYNLKDERGLYLEISPAGGKWWRVRYWFNSKENRLSLGTYPDVSLKDARDKRDEIRSMLAKGIDPSEARKAEKVQADEDAMTFEVVAREWLDKFQAKWSESHTHRITRRLELNIFPWLGNRTIGGITALEILEVIRRIEGRGAIDTAHRTLQNVSQIFRFAVSCGYVQHDPTSGLRGALTPSKEKHHASITDPKAVGALLRAIDDYTGTYIVKSALRLAPLVFARPGELRQAEWTEIDLEAAEWRIPPEKMKMREMHIVPLSRQAVEILSELHPLTGRGRYVFPSIRSDGRPMSSNTINMALRTLGYGKDEMCGHGFRSMASTLLNEFGWNRDAIERQLAHAERNKIRGAYNSAEYLPERRRMMQAWSDHLDQLRAGGKVIPFRHGAVGE